MDRRSLERFKRTLQARHRELRLGLAQTQQESRTAQHDYGKDEGYLEAALKLLDQIGEDSAKTRPPSTCA